VNKAKRASSPNVLDGDWPVAWVLAAGAVILRLLQVISLPFSNKFADNTQLKNGSEATD
jgi:hypothetical protein